MREHFTRTGNAALVAGLALALAACGGDAETGNEAEANLSESNMILDEPANDASALESTAEESVAESPFVNSFENETGETPPPLGETSGGDTGGNTVESNVSGM
jgi:hypothetical protein